MQDMRRNVHDDDYKYLSDDYDSSLRACAKIRVEDQKAEELVSELSQEYADFTRKLALEDKDCETVIIEDNEEHSYVSRGTGLPEADKKRTDEHELELKPSLVERLLRFFGEFYERFMAPGVHHEGQRRMFTAKERLKKRFMLEAIIMMLRRLFLRGKALNLKELLDEQIQELRNALEKEQDPEMRKVLQERLAMLLKLRVQMSNALFVKGFERFLMMLLGSSLASATLTSLQYRGIGLVGESTVSYVQTMSRVVDTGGVTLDGTKVDMGSMHDSVKATDWGYQTSMDRCVADLLPTSVKVAASGLVMNGEMFLVGHFARAEGYTLGSNYVADFINRALQNLVHAVVGMARNVVNTAREIMGADVQRMRYGPTGNRRGHEAAMRAAQDFCRDNNEHFRNVHAQDFCQQAHIGFVHNRDRVERAENTGVCGRDENFCGDMGRVCYGNTNVTFSYQYVHHEQTVREQNGPGVRPCNQLTDVVVACAVQNQISAESGTNITR